MGFHFLQVHRRSNYIIYRYWEYVFLQNIDEATIFLFLSIKQIDKLTSYSNIYILLIIQIIVNCIDQQHRKFTLRNFLILHQKLTFFKLRIVMINHQICNSSLHDVNIMWLTFSVPCMSNLYKFRIMLHFRNVFCTRITQT